MKLVLHHANLRPADGLRRLLESTLAALLPLARIEEARIHLEYLPETSPAYRASAVLVVPGPDLRAATVDHTPHAACAKLLASLRSRVLERAAHRLRRAFGERILPSPSRAVPPRSSAARRR